MSIINPKDIKYVGIVDNENTFQGYDFAIIRDGKYHSVIKEDETYGMKKGDGDSFGIDRSDFLTIRDLHIKPNIFGKINSSNLVRWIDGQPGLFFKYHQESYHPEVIERHEREIRQKSREEKALLHKKLLESSRSGKVKTYGSYWSK